MVSQSEKVTQTLDAVLGMTVGKKDGKSLGE
jgi:hypothetical protein